jgi:survival of motor neuron protein-interacting protein 1
MAEDDHASHPAFHVDGELDPSEGEPADGFTYLKTVRWEANRMDSINVAAVDPRQYDRFQTRSYGLPPTSSLSVPKSRVPSIYWQNKLISNLEEMRETYFEYRRAFEESDDITPHHISYPDLNNEKAWATFCYGEGESEDLAHEPLLSHLIRFDEVSVIRILTLTIKWTKASTFSWSNLRFQWLFSLLVCLDLPIDASLQAELCYLRRACLSKLCSSDNLSDETIAGLNVLVTILERIFGQRDVE